MKPIAAIDIASPCIGWKRVCPDAQQLARDAARVALIDGIAATGFTSPTRVELAITLTDDVQQLQLNRRYRGEDVSTNVLAFRAWEPETHITPGAPLLLGDVVLAFETVAREANEQVKPFCDHVRSRPVVYFENVANQDALMRAQRVGTFGGGLLDHLVDRIAQALTVARTPDQPQEVA